MMTSERYLRVRQAQQTADVVERRRIYEEAIAETEGAERALWLINRAGVQLSLPVPPLDKIKADITEAMALAPDDPDVISGAALTLVNTVKVTQRLSELGEGRRLIPRAVRVATEKWQLLNAMGLLALVRQRNHAAAHHLARALADMAGWGPDRMRVWSGHRFLTHCFHGMAVMELGEVEALRQDVAIAEELYQSVVNQVYVSDRPLALAKAGLALFDGELQEARRELQRIWANEREDKYSRDPQHLKAEMDLMAARIAGAEGNRAAMEHFCQRALERAEKNQLPMTAGRISRIRERLLSGMAG